MKCRDCKGKGSSGEYDGERVPCCACDGTGRVLAFEDASVRVSVWWSGVKEWMAFTRIGRWWWRVWLLEHSARRLAKRETFLQLSARCGHSAHRMAQFARAMEDGLCDHFMGLDRVLDKERRLKAKYDLACTLRAAADKWQTESVDA